MLDQLFNSYLLLLSGLTIWAARGITVRISSAPVDSIQLTVGNNNKFWRSLIYLFAYLIPKPRMSSETIAGKWELYESTGFDEYLKAVGVNFFIRKMITSMSGSSTVEIVKDEDGHILRTISPMKSIETKFKLDVEFDDKLMDGRECKTVFTLNNGVLRQRQFTKDGFETTIDREISPDSMTATIRFKDAVCVRKFKKASA